MICSCSWRASYSLLSLPSETPERLTRIVAMMTLLLSIFCASSNLLSLPLKQSSWSTGIVESRNALTFSPRQIFFLPSIPPIRTTSIVDWDNCATETAGFIFSFQLARLYFFFPRGICLFGRGEAHACRIDRCCFSCFYPLSEICLLCPMRQI